MEESRELLMKLLIELLDKKEFQETLVEELNEAIDIPVSYTHLTLPTTD